MKYKQSWEDMDAFQGIDLFDSFVARWNLERNSLTFNLEVSIWPESKHYSEPKQKEYTCYKSGTLVFNGFSSVNGLLSVNDVKPTRDPDGSIDYGNIEYFVKTHKIFEIHGEFGQVIISGGDFSFEISA